jgi:hypothetical protein
MTNSIFSLLLLTIALTTHVAGSPCIETAVTPIGTFEAAPSSNKTSRSISTPAPTPDITIAITNLYGVELSLSFVLGSTSIPGFTTLSAFATPLGNPQPTILPYSASTQYIFPTGWSGNIPIGRTLQVGNSLIEGNYIKDPWLDVSYVDGFSVPITCSSGGKPITGCNIDLFQQPGITCENTTGSVCINPARSEDDGPAACFFAACAGTAYTFPHDDNAARPIFSSVSCCIGTSCPAPERQPGTAVIACSTAAD